MEMKLDLKPSHTQNKLHCYITLYSSAVLYRIKVFCLSLVSNQHEEHLFLKNLC